MGRHQNTGRFSPKPGGISLSKGEISPIIEYPPPQKKGEFPSRHRGFSTHQEGFPPLLPGEIFPNYGGFPSLQGVLSHTTGDFSRHGGFLPNLGDFLLPLMIFPHRRARNSSPRREFSQQQGDFHNKGIFSPISRGTAEKRPTVTDNGTS